MQIRLLQPDLQAGDFCLSRDNSHHLIKVLRAREDTPLVLFDGRGIEYQAVVIVADPKACLVRVQDGHAVSRESTTQTHLIQSLCLGDKMDWVVEKACELGVSSIQPVRSARSQLRLDGDRAQRRQAHWGRIACAAAAQSGRNLVPLVRPICSLNEALTAFASQPGAKTGWMLDPLAQTSLSAASLAGPLTIAIGPEAGWTDEEAASALLLGFSSVRCGLRILRTETAATVVLAAVATRQQEF